MITRALTSFFLYIVFLNSVYSQKQFLPEKIVYDQEIDDLMHKAKEEIKKENYVAANKTFRKALATHKILPTELSYLFAETLYVVHQYQNSSNFIDKYLSLSGQGDNYYDKAIELKSLLNKEFKKIKNCSYCNLSGYRYKICYNCNGVGSTTETCYNCKGSGKTVCPKCLGEGVSISLNSFGNKQYAGCNICKSKGYILCTICLGEGKLTGTCSVCLKTGKIASSKICNHKSQSTIK